MNLYHLFYNSVINFSQKTAIVFPDKSYTYQEVHQQSMGLARLLSKWTDNQIGIYGARSFTSYSGLLGVLAAGKTYVALNPKHAHDRNRSIIKQASVTVLITDKAGLQKIKDRENDFPENTTLILPEHINSEIPEHIKGSFSVYTKEDLKEQANAIAEVKEEHPAYILFTSGSTGTPKGVPISHSNLFSFINYLAPLYQFSPADRFSQTYDLNFDPSFQNMFLAWKTGAALYIVPEESLLGPAKFIREHNLTVWDSVPSMVQFMRKFRMLKENVFPSLRYSIFGGESLPLEIVLEWKKAAPNSVIENHYGPTETTIGISRYRVPKDKDAILHHNHIVSIGKVFQTQDFCLLDENDRPTPSKGELCLTGSQVTNGYWKDPDRTALQFVSLKNDSRTWYRTGDIVEKKKDHLFFIGRKDRQVKIRGYRIELEEVNLRLKEILQFKPVFSLAYPIINGIAENIYSFAEEPDFEISQEEVLSRLHSKLPDYMIPKNIIFVAKIPVNHNGKTDVQKLIGMIKA